MHKINTPYCLSKSGFIPVLTALVAVIVLGVVATVGLAFHERLNSSQPQVLGISGSISASPNPCTISSGQSACTSTISWTLSGGVADVCVSPAGAADQLVANTGGNGSKEVTWVSSASYTFKLKTPAGNCGGSTVISTVDVTGKTATQSSGSSSSPNTTSTTGSTGGVTPGEVKEIISGKVSASPNPCEIESSKSICTTKISFSVSSGSADVCVSTTGSDNLFSIFSGSGVKDATWITTASYTFKIKAPAGNCQGKAISTENVTGKYKTNPSGSLSANPNPCLIAAEKTTCETKISWDVANTTNADVCVSPAGVTDQLFAVVGAGSGEKLAPWITSKVYTFTLRVSSSGNCLGRVLAKVEVNGKSSVSSGCNVPARDLYSVRPYIIYPSDEPVNFAYEGAVNSNMKLVQRWYCNLVGTTFSLHPARVVRATETYKQMRCTPSSESKYKPTQEQISQCLSRPTDGLTGQEGWQTDSWWASFWRVAGSLLEEKTVSVFFMPGGGGFAAGWTWNENGGRNGAIVGDWVLDPISGTTKNWGIPCTYDPVGYCQGGGPDGTIAHEIGHAFGLAHPCDLTPPPQNCNQTVMQTHLGFPTIGLLKFESGQLSRSPFFASVLGERTGDKNFNGVLNKFFNFFLKH